MSEDVRMRQIALARMLLDDIVLSRLAVQPLLIKTRKLARLSHARDIMEWLDCELSGYSGESDLEVRYLEKTGRFIDKRTWTFYSEPLAELDRKIATIRSELRCLQVEKYGNSECSRRAAAEAVTAAASSNGRRSLGEIPPELLGELSLAEEAERLSSIRSKVISLLHEFVGSRYCTLVFQRLVETIFEKHPAWADALLHDGVGDALGEIPSLYHSLSPSNREALIHGLEQVWTSQPLAWRTSSRRGSDLPSSAGTAPAGFSPQPSGEEALLQFNRVVRELLCGKMNRRTPRRSSEERLLVIRNSARENVVRPPQKAVARPVERSARLA